MHRLQPPPEREISVKSSAVYRSYRAEFEKLRRQDLEEDLIPAVDDELGGKYDCKTLTNLEVEFMRACFNRIAPDLKSQEYVRNWMNYTDAWKSKTQRSEATALRMLLTAQIGYPIYKRFVGLTEEVIAGILLAIRESDRGTARDGNHITITIPGCFDPPFEDPLPRTHIPDTQYSPILEFTGNIQKKCQSLLSQQDIDPDDYYVVYVLDVTPSLEEGEQDVFWSLRRDAHLREKHTNSPKDSRKRLVKR